ncbi:hypothetical protein KUIN1_48510 [Pseudomonas sp. KUIN-1]|nr:hypothetical protein KUIN1_48510 [Pseudomonas sp. KUIN-1]
MGKPLRIRLETYTIGIGNLPLRLSLLATDATWITDASEAWIQDSASPLKNSFASLHDERHQPLTPNLGE